MFNNQKFLTRGIESEIPAWLVHLMWHMVLTMEVKEKDYLQVFKLTKTLTSQHIVHEQEQPLSFRQGAYYDCNFCVRYGRKYPEYSFGYRLSASVQRSVVLSDGRQSRARRQTRKGAPALE